MRVITRQKVRLSPTLRCRGQTRGTKPEEARQMLYKIPRTWRNRFQCSSGRLVTKSMGYQSVYDLPEPIFLQGFWNSLMLTDHLIVCFEILIYTPNHILGRANSCPDISLVVSGGYSYSSVGRPSSSFYYPGCLLLCLPLSTGRL